MIQNPFWPPLVIVDFEHSYYCQGKAPGLVLCSKRSCGGQKEDKHETLHKQVKESNVFKLLCSVALDHKMGGSISLNTMEQVKNLTLATWSSLFPRSCPLPHLSSSQHVLEILFLTHPLLPAHASTWMHWIWPESLVIAPTLSAWAVNPQASQ